MNKKEKAAPQNGTTPNTKSDPITNPIKAATMLEKAMRHLLENGTAGVSSLSGLSAIHDLNYRNHVSELRRHHGVTILDERFEHHHSGGGTVKLKRYWLADRDQARKVAELINMKRKQREASTLSREQIAAYLIRFPAPMAEQGSQPAA